MEEHLTISSLDPLPTTYESSRNRQRELIEDRLREQDATIKEALDLLAWVELGAPYGLPDDSFAERIRQFLAAHGRPTRFWDTVKGVERDWPRDNDPSHLKAETAPPKAVSKDGTDTPVSVHGNETAPQTSAPSAGASHDTEASAILRELLLLHTWNSGYVCGDDLWDRIRTWAKSDDGTTATASEDR